MATNILKESLAGLSPAQIRMQMRHGLYASDSWGLAPGFAQTAMVALPQSLALDFLVFAQRNARPCPLLEVTNPGDPIIRWLAPSADVRTDLARYRVFAHGECVDEPTDVSEWWTDDMMAFVIGCTGSFEQHMVGGGIRLRHLDEGRLVPIYMTNRECEPAGRLHGPLAVSMRPILQTDVARTIQLTARFPAFHGAPIWVGDPDGLGVDLDYPLFGDRLGLEPDEVPMFWACSVTPQLVAEASGVELMITNYPSHMFLTDVPTPQMAIIA